MVHNFRNQNLQGQSFKNQDLTNANFTCADIRGADFTGANLAGANFSHAKAGLGNGWSIGMLIIVAALSAVSGIAAAIALSSSYGSISRQPVHSINFIPTIVIIAVNIIFLRIAIRQGIAKTFQVVAISAAVSFTIVGILGGISNKNLPSLRFFRLSFMLTSISEQNTSSGFLISSSIINLTVAVAATLIAIFALALAVTLAAVFLEKIVAYLAIFEATAVATITAGIIIKNAVRYLHPDHKIATFTQLTAITFFVILAAIIVKLGSDIGWRVVDKDDKYTMIRQIAIFLGSLGGTSFRSADLTNTNFSYAALNSTDFRLAKVNRTLCRLSKKLDWARVENTILSDPAVLDLLVSGNGHKKSYIGANLRGANLISADLKFANFKEADLSEATLVAADLEEANLTQVQAIGTNFSEAKMTGVCGLGSWNIDSSTQLEWVDCQWVYLLEKVKPGTDDRARRPNSGNFAPGDFTNLFEQVLTSIDLIFSSGFDMKAFVESLQKVQVENEGTELIFRGIENKSNGVVVVKVSVPPDTQPEKIQKIHSGLMQCYQEIKSLASHYPRILAEYRQQIQYLDPHLPENEQEIQAAMLMMNQIVKQTCDRVISLEFDKGNFDRGFEVTARILLDHHRHQIILKYKLPPQTEILQLYNNWQKMYQAQKYRNSRIKSEKNQVTNVSIQDITNAATKLEQLFKNWINLNDMSILKSKLCQQLQPTDEVRVIIQTEDVRLRRLPWHLWDFFEVCSQAEVGLSILEGDRVTKLVRPRNRVRILAILGNSEGINLDRERKLLENLPDAEAETKLLSKPSYEELNQQLCDETGWDILCFSGHSRSLENGNTGAIAINDTDELSIEKLETALKIAIERGLQLAIFNSCDGLGLAKKLANLHIPQSIVMREIVPDAVAQEFFKLFLQGFSSGKSLYVAVREAREQLKLKENEHPCASWLPVICQNQSEVPQTWREFRGDNATVLL